MVIVKFFQDINDVKLSKNHFSIKNLAKDNGYKPQNIYEKIVQIYMKV